MDGEGKDEDVIIPSGLGLYLGLKLLAAALAVSCGGVFGICLPGYVFSGF